MSMGRLIKNRWGVLFLVLILSASLLMMGGCGSGDGDNEASDDKTVKIGVLGPFTGPAARVGEEFKASTEMAFEAVDYQIGDHEIELVWIDSESDAEKAARAYEQAIVKDKIDCGFLNWHSWVSVSCMEVAAKYKIPHFFSIGGTDIVNEKYESDPEKYFYWVGKGWPVPEKLSISYVTTLEEAIDKGIWEPRNKKVAMYGVDNDWGRGFANALRSQFEDAGWEVVSEDWVALGETEFYPMLNKLKSLDVSVIAGTMSDPPSVSSFIKQSREVGLESLIICDGLGWVGEWYDLTGEASDYVIDQIPQWATPEAQKFASEFEERYGLEPGANSGGLCYDLARFLVKVLETCDEQYGDINTENLTKIAKDEVMTGNLTLDDGVMTSVYQYTPETFPDPVVDKEHYIFPVIQYFDGEAKIVWPEEWKEQDLQIPEGM
ncbi:MAG: ABC transporter substrate-binding protein [Syntrophaceticus sp.]|nr:ABC transporter substrate-binding protein [Syntrophaceticus sp.]